MSGNKNPYSSNSNRLADVIAAIQVMGTYKFYKIDFDGWADRIEGDESNGRYWHTIFVEHPEFFRLDSKRAKASLVWRRNYQKLYNVDLECNIPREEYRELSSEERERYSRTPLSNDDIATLINTAIKLHNSELENNKDSRWWISGATGLAGVIIGAVLKGIA